ncbi:two-component sensor histidine kinase, partial [Pseudomonas syringae pv. tagetis]
TRLTFQVWLTSGELLVRSDEAPLLSAPHAEDGSHDLIENGDEWCGFLLADPEQGFLICVVERDDVRQVLILRIVSH